MRKTIMALSVIGFGIAGLTGTGLPTQAGAQEVKGPEVTWRLSLWGKRRAFTEGLEYVSKNVSDKTDGNFKLKLFYGQQLSKSKENLDGISVGAFEAALFCAAYHPGKNRPLNVLDLPFLPLGDLDLMIKVHQMIYAHPAAKKALANWNAVLFMPNVLPQYEYMGKGKPPMSLKDFDGMRLRALGGMGRAAKAIGAVPTTVPASETYTALQRGTVDAIGFPYTYTFAAYKLDEVADWYTTNMSLGTVNCPIVFNADSYKVLPDQYKKLLADSDPGRRRGAEGGIRGQGHHQYQEMGCQSEVDRNRHPGGRDGRVPQDRRRAAMERMGQGKRGQDPGTGAAGSGLESG